MAHALAVIAATVATAGIIVMVYLNVLLVSLAFRASRESEPREQTTQPGRIP
jgi:hypothetical protein